MTQFPNCSVPCQNKLSCPTRPGQLEARVGVLEGIAEMRAIDRAGQLQRRG